MLRILLFGNLILLFVQRDELMLAAGLHFALFCLNFSFQHEKHDFGEKRFCVNTNTSSSPYSIYNLIFGLYFKVLCGFLPVSSLNKGGD